MDKKKSIVLYPADILAVMSALSMSDRGQFVTALFNKNFFGEHKIKLKDDVLNLVNLIQEDIDRNNEKYKETLESRRLNGAKGGKKRAENSKQHLSNNQANFNQATSTQLKHNETENETEAVNEDESDNVFIKNNKNKEAENVDKYDCVGAPSVEEVADYCKSSGYTIDPIAFVNWNKERGWMNGKKYIALDWQKAVRKWYCKENNLQFEEIESVGNIYGGLLNKLKVGQNGKNHD